MNRFKQKQNFLLHPLTIFLGGVLLFSLVIVFVHRLPGDDLVFPVQIKPFATVFDWVNYRYQTWSGRIFAESFEYIFSVLPLIFWVIVSIILYAVASGFLFLYYRLFAKAQNLQKDRLMISLALLLPLMMDSHVISNSVLWISGSMNYFWLVSLALAGFYPIIYSAIRGRMPHWLICTVSIITTIVATSSQEQVGAVFVALGVVFVGYLLFQRKLDRKTSAYLLFHILIAICAFIISIKAPGDQKRFVLEAANHLPDFYTVPLLTHIEYAYRWFVDGVVNHFGLLLALNWLFLIILFVHKKYSHKADKWDYAVGSLLAIGLLYLSLKSFSGITYLFTFYPTWGAHPSRLTLFLLLPWTILFITTLIAPMVLFRKQLVGTVVSILFAASFAATAIITLSPSMYASGDRVFYVSCFILVLTAYYLFHRVYDQYKAVGFTALTAIVCLAAPQYLVLLARTIHHQ